MTLKTTFGSHKPIIAMVHFPPLPGSPLYDAKRGMNWIIDSASKDIAALQKGGVDAVMFGNEGDRPYILKATPESLAAYAAAVMALKSEIKVPFGVNYLWDPVATVAVAAATGAKFGREIMTGVYDSDMGIWAPDCAGAVRLRHHLGRDDIKLMYNINAEFASPMGTRTIAQRAKSAVFASLADIVLVSGVMTGEATEASDLRAVKDVLPNTPVFANTGVNLDNVKEILGIGDGVVIGTHFKVDGDTWKAVDSDRVKRFMDKVKTLR
jgi:membrane complex biogenesis BtpA family protein